MRLEIKSLAVRISVEYRFQGNHQLVIKGTCIPADFIVIFFYRFLPLYGGDEP